MKHAFLPKGLATLSILRSIPSHQDHWYTPFESVLAHSVPHGKFGVSRIFAREGAGAMNWDRIEGQWKQRRGKAMQHWGKLMNDELAAIAGRYEDLVGRLQERYGMAREETKGHVAKFKKTVEQLKRSNSKLVRLQTSLHEKEKLVATRARPARPRRKSVRSRSSR